MIYVKVLISSDTILPLYKYVKFWWICENISRQIYIFVYNRPYYESDIKRRCGKIR